MTPWEEEEKWNAGEDHLLENHSEADDGTDHDSKQGARYDQNEGLLEVKHLDIPLSVTHGSHNTDLFCLIHQIGGHG